MVCSSVKQVSRGIGSSRPEKRQSSRTKVLNASACGTMTNAGLKGFGWSSKSRGGRHMGQSVLTNNAEPEPLMTNLCIRA